MTAGRSAHTTLCSCVPVCACVCVRACVCIFGGVCEVCMGVPLYCAGNMAWHCDLQRM